MSWPVTSLSSPAPTFPLAHSAPINTGLPVIPPVKQVQTQPQDFARAVTASRDAFPCAFCSFTSFGSLLKCHPLSLASPEPSRETAPALHMLPYVLRKLTTHIALTERSTLRAVSPTRCTQQVLNTHLSNN